MVYLQPHSCPLSTTTENIKDICKSCTYEEDDWYEDLTKDELNNGMKEVLLKNMDSLDHDFIMVLAFQIVTTGADMPKVIKEKIDWAIKEDEKELDCWNSPEKRKKKLDELLWAVHNYENGKAIDLDSDKGLIVAFMKNDL